MTIQIVGKMQNGKPVIFSQPIDKPVEADDVLKNEQGEYLRVIGGGQHLQSVVIDMPSEESEASYYEAALQEIDEAAHGWERSYLGY